MPVLKPYADAPVRRARQIVADVLGVVWVYVWVRAAFAVHDAVSALAVPGQRLEQAGSDIADGLGSAAASARDVPLVGDALSAPFDAAAKGASGLAGVAQDQQEAVAHLATLLAAITLVLPLALAVLLWLVPRFLFARRAGAAQRFVDSDADLELFALRAMARQPFARLARVSDDPVGAWRRGESEVVRRLALLELAQTGLRPPAG